MDATPSAFPQHLAAARRRNLGRLLPALLVVHAVTALLELMVEASGLDLPLLRSLALRAAVVPLLVWAWVRTRQGIHPPASLLAWLTLPAFAVGHGAVAAAVDLTVGFPLFAGSGWLVVVTAGFLPGRLRDGLGLGFAVAAAYTAAFVLNTGPMAGPMFLVPLGLVLLFSPVVAGYMASNLAANLEAAWHRVSAEADETALDPTQMVDWIAGLVRDTDDQPQAGPPVTRSPGRVVSGPWTPESADPVLVAGPAGPERDGIAEQVSRLGFRAVTVETGPDAVEAVLQQTFALVLLDADTPELDGLDATRLIRALGARGQVPILVLLPAADVDRAQPEIEECGGDGWLAKPVRSGDLRDAVARWVPSTHPS